MTDKEKARAYNEVLEKAKAIINDPNASSVWKGWLCNCFPELAESEDEKIRKKLIEAVKRDMVVGGTKDKQRAIAWLEKQGEKPADKVKPKFKVGDWIINPRTGLIKHIKNVLLCDNNGNYEFESSSMSIDSVDNSFHFWTIQDAKNGDVLANDNEIVIFKENNFNQKDLSGCMFVHCSLRDKKGYWYTIGGINPSNYVPATKEQRDLLFQKMHKAEYEWNAETKELRKINSYCQENCKGFRETGKCFADGECKAKREAEQKSAWSEEDKDYYDAIIAKLEVTQEDAALTDNQMDFLKSLKPQRYLIPSEEEIEKAAQEWDSKANFNPFYMTMENGKPTGVKQSITTHKESFKAGIYWILKSLRRWKPSDEIKKACKAFCKVRCQGKPPRSTCTSLGTCREYDDFRKAMREEGV